MVGLVLALAVAAQNTPEGCVRAFVDAENRQDFDRIYALVDDASAKAYAEAKGKGWIRQFAVPRWKVVPLRTSQVGDRAAVLIDLTYLPKKFTYDHQIVSVRRRNGVWRLQASNFGQSELCKVAQFFAADQPWSKSQATDGPLDPIRELAYCAMDDTDKSGHFLLKADGTYDRLHRYTTRPDLWKKGHWSGPPYSLNTRLCGQLRFKTDVSNTVTFYEGSHEKLDFKHNGRAVVVFIDEHSEYITPQEAKSLRWKPWP